MGAVTDLVVRRRRLVGLMWLFALVLGGYASAILSGHLSMSFEIPGTGSDIADSAIVAQYGTGGDGTPLVPVIRLPAGMTASQPGVKADLLAAFGAAARAGTTARTGPSRVASFASTGNPGFV